MKSSKGAARPPNVTIAEKDLYKYLVPYRSDDANLCALPIKEGAPPIRHYSAKFPDKYWSKFAESYGQLLTIEVGGEWQPDYCVARFLIAILIPLQNRESNLREFLLNMHPFLQRQNIHYRIYALELPRNVKWNKGLLFNAGFVEAMKDKSYPCIILHDVDLLPLHRNNIYACTTGFRQMVVYHYQRGREQVATWNGFAWEGGAIAVSSDHYRLMNGFSNRFYNWGNEDEDFVLRAENMGIQIMRYDGTFSTYNELAHKMAGKNRTNRLTLRQGKLFYHQGLNTTKYEVIRRVKEPLCTRIVIKY